MHKSENVLNKWLQQELEQQPFKLTPLTGDASFRRYYRLQYANLSRIVMEAPPEKETMGPFMAIAKILDSQGLSVPKIYAVNEKEGYAILDDFGDTLLLDRLSGESAGSLYPLAIENLIRMQQCPVETLPVFDKAFIRQELNIFVEWFLQSYLALELSPAEKSMLDKSFEYLSAELLKQPQVFIHRDYHSRNLMLLADKTSLGIIDFQDAMYGPVSYDLVSLLKDCYVQWPQNKVRSWLSCFYEQSPVAQQLSEADFIRAFDLCGLQRHLKVLGVFSRLYLRDNKNGYLKDLPLTLHYVMACLEDYDELQALYQFMQQRIQLP